MSDIEVDTPTPIDPPDPPYPRKNEDELHNQLIEINEEFDSEDLEVLKFLCYDQLPGITEMLSYIYMFSAVSF